MHYLTSILYQVPTGDANMVTLLSKNSQREIEKKIHNDNAVL